MAASMLHDKRCGEACSIAASEACSLIRAYLPGPFLVLLDS
jgi:hypothetical protein